MIDLAVLRTAVGELEEDTVLALIDEVMAAGGDEAQGAMEACREGLGTVGDLFEAGEYFVSDLIYAGEIMNQAIGKLKPALLKSAGEGLGKMILCTVEGDLHDIGKNIVRAMLEAAGFEVLDLGIDVSPAAIVEAAKKEEVSIIGLSGVLTLAVTSMKATVDAFKEAGMRDNVHIIIGGNPVNEVVCGSVGADAWAVNPQLTVSTCRAWAEESR
ncbi:MAG: cobalamin-dependent protein [Oscillospiraceae bacterium]|nr:cobalamin-dependent protein [Oscillospiraceae bacterium]